MRVRFCLLALALILAWAQAAYAAQGAEDCATEAPPSSCVKYIKPRKAYHSYEKGEGWIKVRVNDPECNYTGKTDVDWLSVAGS